MERRIPPLRELAQWKMTEVLERFAASELPLFVVDATAGNGHDTLFLAHGVGERGLVLACDVQQAALDATRSRLEAAGLAERVRLVRDGHEHLDRWLPSWLPTAHAASEGDITAAMFNLGFLPGSDKTVRTTLTTTLAALEILLPRLRVGGCISLHLYTGHSGGREEAEAVLERAARLPEEAWCSLCSYVLNKNKNIEYLLFVERLKIAV